MIMGKGRHSKNMKRSIRLAIKNNNTHRNAYLLMQNSKLHTLNNITDIKYYIQIVEPDVYIELMKKTPEEQTEFLQMKMEILNHGVQHLNLSGEYRNMYMKR